MTKQDQGLGEAAAGDQKTAEQLREQGIEEEKAYGDSAAAVTPDTQQPPQGEGSEGSATGEQQGNVEGETSYGHDQDAEPPQQ